jgi:hypothetical protein
MIKQYCNVRDQWKVLIFGRVNISYWFDSEIQAIEFISDWKKYKQ